MRFLRAFLGGLAAVSLTQIATAQFARPGVETQIKLGKEAAAELRKKEKVLPPSDIRVRTLRRVATRILTTLHDPNPWEFSFDVIDSKQVNAFALPGGSTFFYIGLLDKMTTEDQLAGVLGHELTHVTREHWSHHVADANKRNILLSIGLIITRANDSIAQGVGLANNMYDLKFSRGDETQADDGGFLLMTAAGFNPQGMVDVFKILQASQQGGNNIEFLSDHPADDRRIARMTDRIRKSGKTYADQTPLPKFPVPAKKTGS